jgi:small-conductance mechanosensitive channel
VKIRLVDILVGLGKSIVSAAPNIVLSILLIIVGLIVAKILEVALRTILVRAQFQRLTEKAGVAKLLRRMGIREQWHVFLPRIASSLIILLSVKTASDVLGWIAVSNAIGAIFGYLPNVTAALLLLILGTTVGQFAGRMLERAAESAGIEFAPALGKLISAFIIFIVAMMALAQLKIDTGMIRIVSTVILGTGALAFGLAFGLGTREIVRNIVTGFYARKFLAIGKVLDVGSQKGVLTAITPTHSILTWEGRDIVVPNSAFLEQTTVQ